MVKGGAQRPTRGAITRTTGPVLRALLRQRRRLVLAGLAIALGVGYLAGALGLLDRIGAGLDDLATASADSAGLVVEGGVAYQSSVEQVRRLVPSTIVDSAERVKGVKSASHRLEDVAVLVDAKGKPIVAPGLSEQPLGVNWPEDPSISTYLFLSGGPPGVDKEVAIDANSAEAAGVGVGDAITVAGKGKVGEYRISGVIDPAAGRLPDGSSLVVLTTPEARAVFDRPIDDNRVSVVLEDGADAAAVSRELGAIVPPGTEVVDAATAARHQQEGLTRSFALVRALVTGFGVLALLVGMLTVANSLSLLHAERRQLFATFRLVGAKVPQLRRAALTEALLLALAASVVAIPLGVLLAVLIEKALGALGTAVPTAGPVLSMRAVLWAVGLGVGATLVAAWRPVSRACSVSPVEAIQPTESVSRRSGWSSVAVTASWAVVAGVAAAGVAVLADQAPLSIAGIGVATAAVVIIVGGLPWVLSRAVAATVSILPFRPRPLRRITARGAVRNPRRTAATTVAVLLAAAVVSGLAVFLQSFSASVNAAVEGLVNADLVVDSGTFTRGGLPGDLVAKLSSVDGVKAVSGWQLGRGYVGDVGVRMTGVDGANANQLLTPTWKGTPPDGVDDSTAWISQSLAERARVSVGDSLPLAFTSGGVEQLRVTGIYTKGSALLGDVVTDRQVLVRQVPATVDLAALVDTDGAPSTRAAVKELAASYGVTSVLSPQQFVDSRSNLLRGFQRVIEWMLVFTLLQALVGVVNTLMLSVGERRREFGLLRVSGASRSQVRRMVLFEGTALALVGTLVGVAVGVFGAWLGVQALASLGLGVFAVPVPTVLAVIVAAVGVGVASAAIPARMAAGVPALEAVLDSGVEFIGERQRGGTKAAPAAVAVPMGPSVTPLPHTLVRSPFAPPPYMPPSAAPVAAIAAAPVSPAPVPEAAEPVAATAAPVAAAEPVAATAAVSPAESSTTPASVGAALDDDVLAAALQVVFRYESTGPAEPEEAAALRALYPADAPAASAPEPVLPAAPTTPAPEPVLPAAPFAPAAPAAPTNPAPEPDLPAAPVVPAAPTAPAAPPTPVSEPVVQVPEPVAANAGEEIELPPVVAAPVAGPGEGSESSEAEAASPSDSPVPAAAGDSTSRREKLRRRSGVRLPRRRQRRDTLAPAAEGWVESGESGPGAAQVPAEEAGVDAVMAAAVLTDESLARAVRRLDSQTVLHAAGALTRLGSVLAPGELLVALVCGRTRGWPTAVARTDRRVLLVVDRDGRPIVESLHPVATTVVVRRSPDGSAASVAVFDRGRMVEITDVADTDLVDRLVRRDVLTT